jgi:hypothetical protein
LFAQQYTLRDAEGAPLRKRRYRVLISNDAIVSGVTDSVGRTQRIYAEEARSLSLEIEP